MRIFLTITILLALLLSACSGGDKALRASYLAGEEAFQQNKPSVAMKHYLSAYEESKRLDNHYWHAKTAERISDILFAASRYPESVRYRTEAIEAYGKADSLVDKTRAEHRLELMSEYDGRITERLHIQDSLFTAGYRQSNLDSILVSLSGAKRMSPLIALTEIYGLDFLGEWLQPILPDKEKLEGAVYLANFLRQENKMSQSDSSLIEAKRYAASDEDRVMILYALYQNARFAGDQSKSLAMADSIFRCQESITHRILMETIDGAHSEFYAERAIRNEMKSRMYLFISIVIVLMVCLTAFLIWRVMRLRAIAQRAQLEAAIEAVSGMKALADTQKLKMEDLLKLQEDANEKNLVILESLFKDKWKTLNTLCEEYYESGGSTKMKDAVAGKIEAELNKIGSEEGLQAIEEEVDRYLDGIVKKLRLDFPSLKPRDIAFCALIFAGFSTKAICFILDIQSGNFYVKKGRLIKKFNEADTPHKQEFLSRLRQ